MSIGMLYELCCHSTFHALHVHVLHTGHKISFIQRVLEMSVKECGQGYLKLFASPWAPPAWMTQTNSTLKNPSLRGVYCSEMQCYVYMWKGCHLS